MPSLNCSRYLSQGEELMNGTRLQPIRRKIDSNEYEHSPRYTSSSFRGLRSIVAIFSFAFLTVCISYPSDDFPVYAQSQSQGKPIRISSDPDAEIASQLANSSNTGSINVAVLSFADRGGSGYYEERPNLYEALSIYSKS